MHKRQISNKKAPPVFVLAYENAGTRLAIIKTVKDIRARFGRIKLYKRNLIEKIENDTIPLKEYDNLISRTKSLSDSIILSMVNSKNELLENSELSMKNRKKVKKHVMGILKKHENDTRDLSDNIVSLLTNKRAVLKTINDIKKQFDRMKLYKSNLIKEMAKNTIPFKEYNHLIDRARSLRESIIINMLVIENKFFMDSALYINKQENVKQHIHIIFKNYEKITRDLTASTVLLLANKKWSLMKPKSVDSLSIDSFSEN